MKRHIKKNKGNDRCSPPPPSRGVSLRVEFGCACVSACEAG